MLVITMNYTGDVLNFGMAAEKAKAKGVETEFYAIADDVGVGRAKGGKVGRRGIGGGILVLKTCGALSELGGSLSEVYGLAKLVTANLVSLGSSLEHVHVPGREAPEDEDLSKSDEIEIGMGIHNEPGSGRVRATLPELVKTMLAQLLDPNDKDRYYVDIPKGSDVVLFINNLGGVSYLELGGITAEIIKQMKETWGLEPKRIIAGTYLTSLNGMGFSASILKLVDTGLGKGKSMLELIDLPAEATGWAAPIQTGTWNDDNNETMDEKASGAKDGKPSNLTLDPNQALKILDAACQKVIACEAEVTKYDTIVGDGDCGIGLKRGAEAVMSALGKDGSKLPNDAVAFVNKIVPVVEDNMDGTSGAIYAIFLNALAVGLKEQDKGGKTDVTAQIWAKALQSAMKDLAKYTPAQPGDRTLMDALVPFVKGLEQGDVKKAAADARKGAEETKGMKASLGRAVYVGGEEEWVGKVPDPGAWGLAEFFQGMADACS